MISRPIKDFFKTLLKFYEGAPLLCLLRSNIFAGCGIRVKKEAGCESCNGGCGIKILTRERDLLMKF